MKLQSKLQCPSSAGLSLTKKGSDRDKDDNQGSKKPVAPTLGGVVYVEQSFVQA